jgi:hypothetical protein
LPGAPAVIGADHTREGYAVAIKLALIYPPDLAAKGLELSLVIALSFFLLTL